MASAADIYQQAIKSLAAEATGHGTLEAPSGRAFLDNPLCGDCVEMQVTDDGQVAIRDSKIPELGAYVFTATSWASFLTGVQSGEI